MLVLLSYENGTWCLVFTGVIRVVPVKITRSQHLHVPALLAETNNVIVDVVYSKEDQKILNHPFNLYISV